MICRIRFLIYRPWSPPRLQGLVDFIDDASNIEGIDDEIPGPVLESLPGIVRASVGDD